jgi:hypothetical protein
LQVIWIWIEFNPNSIEFKFSYGIGFEFNLILNSNWIQNISFDLESIEEKWNANWLKKIKNLFVIFILSDSDVEKKEVRKDMDPFYLDKIPNQKLFVLKGQNNIGLYTCPPKTSFNHHSNLTLIHLR